MKNKENNSKFNKIAKKVLAIASAIAVSLGVIAVNFAPEDPYFTKFRTNYDSDLAYIKSLPTLATSNHVTMTEAANNTTADYYADNLITIENAQELKTFSTMCNSANKDTYLKYNYILIDNIDAESINNFKPIGWETGHEFKGTFNGQGYEIKGLDMIILLIPTINNSSFISSSSKNLLKHISNKKSFSPVSLPHINSFFLKSKI